MRWLAFFLAIAAWPALAQQQCRQALALGLDVSGSVDAIEYRLQLDGLARALLRPEVQAAFLAFPDAPVRLYVYEWAGFSSQRQLLPWTPVASADDLARIAATLRGHPRIEAEPATAIGQAMLYGARALSRQAGCWKRTLDLSGDGKSNTGPRPRDLKGDPRIGDLTINGLVIGGMGTTVGDRRQAEVGDIWAYYTVEVIRGPQAFVEVALGFQDFEEAMARKLLKELETLVVGDAGDARPVVAGRN
jgi:hypothetical protein